MTTRATPTLSEPIEVAEWWQTRAGKAIVIRLLSWKNRNLVDVRIWKAEQGRLKPTKRGLACELKHIRRLASALNITLMKATELNLIDDGDGADQ